MKRLMVVLLACASAVRALAWVDVGSLDARAPEQVQRITLDFEGTLTELRDVLHEQHSITLGGVLRDYSPVVTLLDPVLHAQVELHVTAVTPTELVAEACRQAGCVYRRLDGAGRIFEVQPGDRSIDPRPTVEVGDYRIRVERVEVADTASLDFRWGSEEARARSRNELELAITAEARTVDAARLVYGLSGGAEVVTGAGEELRRTGSQRWVTQPFGGHPIHLSFPPPTRPARSAVLTGKLFLFSDVATVDATLDLTAPGQPVEADGTTWTLLEWERTDDGWRAVTGADGTVLSGNCNLLSSMLIGPNGQRLVGSQGMRRWTCGVSPMVSVEWHFDAPAWEPVALAVSGTAGTEPLRMLEFRIEDIPLPAN